MENQEVKQIEFEQFKNQHFIKVNDIQEMKPDNEIKKSEDEIHKENFINGLKRKLINIDTKYHNVENIKTKIDDIDVIISIEYNENTKDDIKYFKLQIKDNCISTICYSVYNHNFYNEYEKQYKYTSHYDFNINNEDEMNNFWNLVKRLKKYKYNKIKSVFEPEDKIELHKKYNDSVEYLFDIDCCSVCNDSVGEYERIKCNHFLCKKCAHQMIKRKNRKCPICREKCVDIYRSIYCDSDVDSEEDE